MKHALISLLVALLVWEPLVVYAQPSSSPVRAVVVSLDEKSASGVYSVISDLKSSGVEVVAIRASADEALEDLKTVGESAALLKQAKTLYGSLAFDRALSTLSAARANADYITLRGSYFLEAQIHQALRRDSSMLAALENYAVLGGEKPDESFYAPAFIRAFTTAKKRVQSRPIAFTEIRPNATGVSAQIVVDGVPVGEAPAQIRNLRIGPHHVEIRALGFRPYLKTVFLSREGLSVAPRLQPLGLRGLAAMASRMSSEEEASALLSLLQEKSGGKGLVIVSENNVRVVKDGRSVWSRPVAGASLNSGDLARVRGYFVSTPAVAKKIPEALQPRPSQFSPPPAVAETASARQPKKSHWYTSWWFWTIVGAAAAAGGGTTAYMMTRGGGDGNVTVIVTPK